MRKLVGVMSAVVLVTVAIFDAAKESREALGLGLVMILLIFGIMMWGLLSKLNNDRAGKLSVIPIQAALWSHSLLEGLLAAAGFAIGWRQGLIIITALLVHLLPEALAVITILKQRGISLAYGLRAYAVSIICLLVGFSLPAQNKTILTSLATLVAGGFIYLAASSLKLETSD